MLIHLDINNYLLIQQTTVHFQSGLTVVTGESGSGKSILIEALNRVFSGPINHTHALKPHEPIVLSVTFQILPSHPLYHDLKPYQRSDRQKNDFKLCRTIKSGRSTHHLNGQKIPASMVKKLQSSLIFYLAQHASLAVLKPESIAQTLDQLIEPTLRNDLHQAYDDWYQLNQQQQHDQSIINQMNDPDLQRYFLNELDILSPSEDELSQLKSEFEANQDILKIQDTLMQCMSSTQSFVNQTKLKAQIHHLYELTHQSDLLRHIKTFEGHLTSLEQWLSDMMEDSLVSQQTSSCKNSYEQYQQLAAKHRVSVDQLISLHQNLATKLQAYDQAIDRIPGYENQIHEKYQIYQKNQQRYLAACQNIAAQINEQIQTQLPLLGLKQAHFSIRITEKQRPPCRTGNLTAQIWFSSHHSKKTQLIDEVASGGEKARIALLMNLLVQKNHQQKLLIFDEADIGLGGKTAAGLGELLKNRARNQSILCITHLPQVASHGNHHLSVCKQHECNKTDIQLLNSEQKVTELARMLGGKTISNASLSQAKQLLLEANKRASY
jgi:DNA repair protein RecN (Recombination protein N)